MNRRKKAHLLKKLTLSLCSVFFCYLLIELLFPYSMRFLPLKLKHLVDDGLVPLTEKSRSSKVPHNYIAILGDSYAKGKGDWLFNANPNSNPDHNIGHILHNTLKRDILNMGRSGSGNLWSMVELPVAYLNYINASFHFDLSNPEQFVIFFYEGNDLNNNLLELKKYEKRCGTKLAGNNFQYFYESCIVNQSHIVKYSKSFRLWNNLFFAKFIRQVIQNMQNPDSYNWTKTLKKLRFTGINLVDVGGKIINLPDHSRGPALELSSDELETSITLFIEAIKFLHNRFKNAKFLVVYFPSTLSSYHIISKNISSYPYQGKEEIFPSSFVRDRSNEIYQFMEKALTNINIPILDTREHVLSETKQKTLHGPKDWGHFNRQGYELVARLITNKLIE